MNVLKDSQALLVSVEKVVHVRTLMAPVFVHVNWDIIHQRAALVACVLVS